MAKKIKIKFAVPAGHRAGDYCYLCGNGGSGDVDYNNAIAGPLEMFPGNAGIFGYGLVPYGKFPYGKSVSLRTAGYGKLPYGKFPYGHGTAVITAITEVTECGTYKYGFAVYDRHGNLQSGTPGEVTVTVHVTPPKPTGLKKSSYNKTTDVLTLAVAG